MATTIAILVFEGVEELDFVGPYEVFAAWASQHPDDAVSVSTVAWTKAPVRCAKRLVVMPELQREQLGSPDLLVVPGGHGTRALMDDAELMTVLRDANARDGIVASVCTGSLLLGAAGLLDGLPATSHHTALDRLAAAGTDITVRPDDRFVDNGAIVTAAGVSAGIDMALHLVARLASRTTAQSVRRYIQYDPAPPV